MIGIIIGPTSSGPFPSPNFKGRKNFALLTRFERTVSVSVSVCMSLVCLKSKCSECVWFLGDHSVCSMGGFVSGQKWLSNETTNMVGLKKGPQVR